MPHAALEEVFAQTMPGEMGFDYSGISFQEKKCGCAGHCWCFNCDFMCKAPSGQTTYATRAGEAFRVIFDSSSQQQR
jgi:hypothetical protein